MLLKLAFSSVLFVGGPVWAMTPYKQSLTKKTGAFVSDGVFTGGKAGGGTTLLGVRHAFNARLERIIFDLGNKDAKPAGKDPGYFQAAVDSSHKRITFDLTQLMSTQVTEAKLKDILKNSPHVAAVDFTLDPEDHAGTIVLTLKQPMRLETFQMLETGKPARVVLDLVPLKSSVK